MDGSRSYFPIRKPQTVKFKISDPEYDQYAKLYCEEAVEVIGQLHLPRYGLAKYVSKKADEIATNEEKKIIDNLNRAGRRLVGFCRTNLFKRLESCGHCYLISLERHILRNMVAYHALENNLPVPIGPQDAGLLDTSIRDVDIEIVPDEEDDFFVTEKPKDIKFYEERVAEIYNNYSEKLKRKFSWINPKIFKKGLKKHLLEDVEALADILSQAGEWNPENDNKLHELNNLLVNKHPDEKVLVFTQYSDTAYYLTSQLEKLGLKDFSVVTGETGKPVDIARRFSPKSNGGLKKDETELRVIITTDVLSEGQNLQDSHIVINYDLPWAIIRLIQRAGRVDRIGQEEDSLLVYSYLPADGVENIIQLRSRLMKRLEENEEVVGSDETFFGEESAMQLRDLYTERSGILDDDEDEDVDLSSVAQQVWNSAGEKDQKAAKKLPQVVSATRPIDPKKKPDTQGIITFLRFPDDTEALIRVDRNCKLISQSLTALFRSSSCTPDTPALEPHDNHYKLIEGATKYALQEQMSFGGQLGTLRSTRRKLYERLNSYRQQLKDTQDLFTDKILLEKLEIVIDAIYRSPLKEQANSAINRHMRLGITDEQLVEMVIEKHKEEHLCTPAEDVEFQDTQIMCTLGIKQKD